MEDTINGISLFFFLLITLIMVVWGFYVIIVKTFILTFEFAAFKIYGSNPFRYLEARPRELAPFQQHTLHKYFEYYRNMPPQLQRVFRSRLAKFMRSKTFETRQELELKEEMKIMISACAIQLTFGLSDFRLNFFKRIMIYPEAYYSRITKQYHKGEVNANGLIVFSWKDFLAGYSNPHDNLNLGLHEFAHALFINYQKNHSNCINLDSYYSEWRRVGDAEFFKMRGRKENYLREYGSVNLMEFFAVCVEHFFETPHAFKSQLPELYQTLSKFLAQDPSKWVKA
jgi:MtfA peptidase